MAASSLFDAGMQVKSGWSGKVVLRVEFFRHLHRERQHCLHQPTSACQHPRRFGKIYEIYAGACVLSRAPARAGRPQGGKVKGGRGGGGAKGGGVLSKGGAAQGGSSKGGDGDEDVYDLRCVLYHKGSNVHSGHIVAEVKIGVWWMFAAASSAASASVWYLGEGTTSDTLFYCVIYYYFREGNTGVGPTYTSGTRTKNKKQRSIIPFSNRYKTQLSFCIVDMPVSLTLWFPDSG